MSLMLYQFESFVLLIVERKAHTHKKTVCYFNLQVFIYLSEGQLKSNFLLTSDPFRSDNKAGYLPFYFIYVCRLLCLTGVHLVGFFPSKIKEKSGMRNRLAPTSSRNRPSANSLLLVQPYFRCGVM